MLQMHPMRTVSKLAGFALVLFAVCVAACKKDENISPVPEIAFMKFNGYSPDSADIRISFKDGDADIEKGKVKLVYQHDSSGAWVGNVSFLYTIQDFPEGTNANATSGEII